jgi:hypothetical protein
MCLSYTLSSLSPNPSKTSSSNKKVLVKRKLQNRKEKLELKGNKINKRI